MNRRDFLRLLGVGAVSVAAPKFYFDYGKNLHLYREQQIAETAQLISDRLFEHILKTNPIVELLRREGMPTNYPMIEIRQEGNLLLCSHNPTEGIVGGIYRG